MLFIQRPTAARARTVKPTALPFVFLVFLFSPMAWSQQPDTLASQGTDASARVAQDARRQAGSISGKVVDLSGANIVGAVVKLIREGESSELEVTSGQDGQFVFSNVAPGDFRLTITFPGLASQEFSGTMLAGQNYVTPVIMLVIPTQVTEIHVGLPPEELETVQIHDQLKQRVLGFIPNFYVSYIPNAAALTPKHKFELAWKSATDPVTLIGVGVLSGIDQAGDRWRSYGQGAEGYAKRYGATYANVFAATYIGGAILPSVLKQDPRYFYKGTGTKRHRILYALAASSVICKGDNGHWQPNYSNVLGSFAAAGIANLYIPASDRRNVGSFIVSSAVIRIGEASLGGLLQEFVFPKLSHRARSQQTPNQQP